MRTVIIDGRGLERIGDFDVRSRSVAEAFAPVLRETSTKQPANPRRGPGRQRPKIRLALEDGGERLGYVVTRKCASAGKHLVQHTPERPEVAPLVRRFALRL